MASRPVNAYGMPNGTYSQTQPNTTPPNTNTNPNASMMTTGGQPGSPQRLSDPSQGGIAAPNDPSQMPTNLGDPSTWMNMVHDPTQLSQWVSHGLGSQGSNQGLVDYYTGKIQGQPGANPTEQAGSANYWMQKLQNDPHVTGQQAAAPQQGANSALLGALGGGGPDATAQAQGAGNYGAQTAQNVMQSLALKQALGGQQRSQQPQGASGPLQF